jgi:hypothetical protein
MVSAGWAWAFTAFSDQYVDGERRAAARGVAFARIIASLLGVAGAKAG